MLSVPSTDPDLLHVILLAVVQGLTEFLPVSSSGHLVLAGEWLGLEEPGLFLPILLHLGTLAAVLAVYRSDVALLIRELSRGELRETGLLVVATLPTVAVGLLLHSTIREAFGSVHAAAGGLLLTASVLTLGEGFRKRNSKEDAGGRAAVRPLDALLIGCAQALAILPGVSRSGSTIATGMMLGIRADRAARFSFLMSIPAILGATILEGKELLAEGALDGVSYGGPLLGLLVSALVGLAALRWLLAFVAKGAFRWFAVYCALLGTATLVFS